MIITTYAARVESAGGVSIAMVKTDPALSARRSEAVMLNSDEGIKSGFFFFFLEHMRVSPRAVLHHTGQRRQDLARVLLDHLNKSG